LTAARGEVLSDQQLHTIYAREYQGVQPSPELNRLFSFTWRRLYTWNIDDALLNVSGQAQRRRPYNGMIDKAVELEGPQQLHMVFLHGEVAKPEHGFIMTEAEYWSAIKSEKHYWYQRAAQDYFAFCPVFIGSSLDEPILAAELERVKRDSRSPSGRAFLVTPDVLTPIKRGSLKARGIIHLQGTLKDFADLLQRELSNGWTAKDVVSSASRFTNEALDALTRDDLEIARSLKPIKPAEFRNHANALSTAQRAHFARQFLRGFPPNWTIASSNIPVKLEGTASLARELSKAIQGHEKLFVVAGQSGSGKTTATMMALLEYAEQNKDVDVYELSSDARSPRRAFSLLKKLSAKKAVIFVDDMFLFGEALREDLEGLTNQEITVVSTARSSEWADRLARHYPGLQPFFFQRFVQKDFDPLIDRLIEYVPSPKFRLLSRKEQREKLKESNSQLLIALRTATESEQFTDIITNEFESLPDDDTRLLLLIVGLGTLARTGISREATRDAYVAIAGTRSFEDALAALDGIVAEGADRRYHARHELYVRHIIEDVATFNDFAASNKAILRTYLKFNIPIVRSVNRIDGYLFRFLFNHDFIFEHASRHEDLTAGRRIYSEFEVDFQLDGHFWLQYGLYLAEMGELDESVDMLRRSVQAFPGNFFAIHALADIQLKVARARSSFDTGTRELVDQAVKSLLLQDAQFTLDVDVYPAVTLANGHLSVLIKHNETAKAKKLAADYFDRLQQLDKKVNSAAVKSMKEKVFRYATLGEWDNKYQGKAKASRPRSNK
jgi:hypothetical protein